MRGFLSLEPDEATHARLLAAQNRLRDGLTRQGVHFPDRLGPTLLAWPFGHEDEIAEAARLLTGLRIPALSLEDLAARPNADRPAEVGFAVERLAPLQDRLFTLLRSVLDPDLPKPAFVRLARVSPPSRKVGAALRAIRLEGPGEFGASGLGLWVQTPTGFDLSRLVTTERD